MPRGSAGVRRVPPGSAGVRRGPPGSAGGRRRLTVRTNFEARASRRPLDGAAAQAAAKVHRIARLYALDDVEGVATAAAKKASLLRHESAEVYDP
eukprot:2136443-Prymnesium_polylepis.1